MSPKSLTELLAQKAAIEKQIALTQREQRAEAIAKVRALMAEYGLSLADISGRSAAAPRPRAASKVAAKYHDRASGQTWSGRGLKPKWLTAALAAGRSLSEFEV
ncbi:MAG: H-NS histone family protein [Burkholderiales bacterium]|nr:H-NS histone family protein [Burkholderiales bacterium]MDE2504934.1 H-NS histone family protein [Burkholderiales bacterium]